MLTVLVVDDEPIVRALLQRTLERDGYRVDQAENGFQALDKVQDADLVVLDVAMPGLHGFQVLQDLRRDYPDLPVLMLTAQDEENSRVRGLRLGADDYMGKPLRPQEFLARVQALLRRTKRSSTVKIGELEIDPTNEDASLKGRSLQLTPTEFQLLFTLARHPGETISRGALFTQVWGSSGELDERIVDNYIVRLRRKLGDNPKKPRYLETSFGRGYRLRSA